METHEEEIVRNSAFIKDAKKRFWLKVIGLVFVVSLVGMVSAGLASYYTVKSAAEDGTELAQQVKSECDRPGLRDPDLAQFCPKADTIVNDAPTQVLSDPVPGPPGETGETGAQGAAGPAPSSYQVLTAVRRFCKDTLRCDGVDGKNATPAQVAIAISSYCDSRGQCRGATGDDGTDAPPVTQAQIITALDTYCGVDACQGPPGEPGADGQNGSDSNVPGPPGVVGVTDNCEAAPDGMVIADVDSSYNADAQTVVISCTYKDDQSGVLPPS